MVSNTKEFDRIRFPLGFSLARYPASILFVLMFGGIAACIRMPDPPSDDEGNATFAAQLIPALLGRQPRGVDEIEVVADIAQLHGRAAAVQMLMKDNEFVDHWADAIIDLIKLQREPTGGIRVAQDGSCWGTPSRQNPDIAIAKWVRDHGPTDPGAPTPAWNMTDLVRSAIALDDLSPILRANLFPVSMRLASTGDKRAALTEYFLQTYLNRDITCLRCHNPTLSASNREVGGNIVWRRLWAISGHPEKALFGNYYDAISTIENLKPIFRSDVRTPAPSAFGIRPWGMSADCARDTDVRSPANNGKLTATGFKAITSGPQHPAVKFGNLDGATNPRISIWELEEMFRDGVADLRNGYERFSPSTPSANQLLCDANEVFSTSCVGCHSGASPAGGLNLAGDLATELVNAATESGGSTNLKRVVPGSTATSEVTRRINGGSGVSQMPPGSTLTQNEITKIDSWIAGGAPVTQPETCNISHVPDVDPNEAMAYLTAANLVDGIWETSFAHRLTIDHGFPRNKAQRDALWTLTEYSFLPNRWSLKSVLTTIWSSNWVARRAPVISQADTSYELPLVLDPWVEADPSINSAPAPHEIANGQGELVARYRVNTILRRIASALAWKEPKRFPDNLYPSPLDQQLGQYISPGKPGFRGVTFQSLLALESTVGLCNKSGKNVSSEDWIDKLVSEVTSFNSTNPNAPITLGQVWNILKDRIIQDPTVEQILPSGLASVANAKTEEQALIAFLVEGIGGTLSLNSSATSISPAQLNSKLRESCGVVVKTPQFLLSNLSPRGYSDNNMPDPPRLNVCMPGEACGYDAVCRYWSGILHSMGKYTVCEDRTVRKTKFVISEPLPDEFVFERVKKRTTHLCPDSICKVVSAPATEPCLKKSTACDELIEFSPVLCDPRVGVEGERGCPSGVVDYHDPALLVAWLENSVVEISEGVTIRRRSSSIWQPLESGYILQTGDLLHVPLTAKIRIHSGERSFGVNSLNAPSIEGVHAHLISVTGKSAQRVLDVDLKRRGALTISELDNGIFTGTLESKAVSKEEWQRIIAYGMKPHGKRTLSLSEIEEINKDFDNLHFPVETGLRPDGSSSIDDNSEKEPPLAEPTNPGETDNPPLLWLVWMIFALVVFLLIVGLWRSKLIRKPSPGT